MKTQVSVHFYYSHHVIAFAKDFDLPFTPFYGMIIDDRVDSIVNFINVETTDFQRCGIHYDPDTTGFHIDIRHVWRRPVSDDTVDYVLDMYTKTNWKREDATDIDELKKIMAKGK